MFLCILPHPIFRTDKHRRGEEGLLLEDHDYLVYVFHNSRYLFFCAAYFKNKPGKQQLAQSQTIDRSEQNLRKILAKGSDVMDLG